jgi:replicative DNA helicase
MSAAQTWFRMACGDLGVDMNAVRSGNTSTEKRSEIMQYAAGLGEKYQENIIIYESPMTPADILSAAMIEQPDILYIDTLKNIAGKPARDNMQSWYDFVINFLRLNVAKSCNTHVQILHHLNRSTFKENRKPSMHDLMFAGESDPDAVFLLWRKVEDYGKTNDNGAPRNICPITWVTDKSRFGWTGDVEVNFDLPHQKFFGMMRENASLLGKEFDNA